MGFVQRLQMVAIEPDATIANTTMGLCIDEICSRFNCACRATAAAIVSCQANPPAPKDRALNRPRPNQFVDFCWEISRGALLAPKSHRFTNYRRKVMNTTSEKTAGTHSSQANTPKKGERYRCRECGMELQITADCKCDEPDHVHLQCCGQEMQKL